MALRFVENSVEPENPPPAPAATLSIHELNALWEHGSIVFERNEYEEALAIFRRILRKASKSRFYAPVWANVGIAHAHLGEYYTACQAFERATKLDPGNAIYWYLLSLAKFSLNKYRDAKSYTDACLACFPRDMKRIDNISLGLNFVLEKDEVLWNLKHIILHVNWKMHGPAVPYQASLNRLPAGRLFKPPLLA